jgi:3-hydroxybutyryl-CoA dehydrogenase
MADKVQFFNTGSEATAQAIRIARVAALLEGGRRGRVGHRGLGRAAAGVSRRCAEVAARGSSTCIATRGLTPRTSTTTSAVRPAARAPASRSTSPSITTATARRRPPGTVAFVLGGKARLSGLWVDDAYVAQHVAQEPESLIGVLSVDPTQDGWQDEMRVGHRELGLRGITLLPMCAGFYPNDARLDQLWRYASDHGLPVLLHTGTTFISQSPIDCTLPRHLDPVAIRFPQAKIILAHGRIAPDAGATWRRRYREVDDVAGLVDCDFVIESVPEDLAVKRSVLAHLEAAVGDAVPIATNTSSIPVGVLQANARHPNRIVRMHWAAPCHATRFLEVIRGEQTDTVTVEATMALGAALVKEPSLLRRDVAGFIANRLDYAMYREAFHLLDTDVADVETIDRAFRQTVGLWAPFAGPFRWMDMTGLPAYADAMTRLFPKLSNATTPPKRMTQLIAGGALGVAKGRGFYTYTPAEAAALRQRLADCVGQQVDDAAAPVGDPSRNGGTPSCG